ncbi:MAG: Citrate transporter, partial [Firmicutes bacterium]|nr:Citrate transporter [Bacillota bacterium]
GVLNISEAMAFVSWETIGLLFGMFSLVAILSEAGFFQFLALWVAEKLDYKAAAIFIVFPLMSAFLAAFIDSITVMLFLVSLTYEISRVVKMNPIPLVIAEVCAANIGGAATLVGDPPNVILGTMLGFTFNDFAANTGPIAIVGTLVCVGMFYLREKKHLAAPPAGSVVGQDTAGLRPGDKIKDLYLLKVGMTGFIAAIILLTTHTFLEHAIGIKISVAEAALIPAIIAILFGGHKTHDIIHRIDIDVLLFFIALFVIVGGLEKTHVIKFLADSMVSISGGNPYILLAFLVFGAGYTSGVVDNVPLALTMGVILKDISQTSSMLALPIMVWALALGVDIGGNITPIGASANVVAYSSMEKFGSKVGWGRWIGYAFWPTTVVVGSVTLSGLRPLC